MQFADGRDEQVGVAVLEQEAGRSCTQRAEQVLVEVERGQGEHPGSGFGGGETAQER
ncbi:hypothetical protein [Nonomuraea sp. NEAU-A123]|uniref:hypothetical protein n=1 Tax=Nonomuraea sp. NEAU-A123 TaxID=2839649 RepID=UPI001BE456DF|nr:hypothetical protein [Nonomuraea sp. NEAU-A123]MBT2235489.1 hypothetical protein [Nonomuraea sp. NEAU-A123]